jgi:geranylgeranyl diphosphate synthase type II
MYLANEEEFAQIDPGERILLLPQCLRPNENCPGKFSQTGLACPEDCMENCVIRTFRQEAARQGYRGVCVAAGGKMAFRFVKENGAKGIVAVACQEELRMGVKAVEGMEEYQDGGPAIVIVPLVKDGCVDTEVDASLVMRAINLRS